LAVRRGAAPAMNKRTLWRGGEAGEADRAVAAAGPTCIGAGATEGRAVERGGATSSRKLAVACLHRRAAAVARPLYLLAQPPPPP
jgi:hypothetical protein